MSTLKTLENDANVIEFIDSAASGTKKQDSLTLLDLFSKVTGEKPRMWGSSIIGFGKYHYKSERSAQEGDWPLIAFSPRKQNLTLYLMPGFDSDNKALLGRLGKHKTSKGCLYINKLSDIDISVLQTLIEKSYSEAKQQLTTSK